MAEHPNVQRIREAYSALSSGDLTAALKDMAPAGVIHFKGSGPLSGDHMGVDNIKTALVGAFALSDGTQHFEIEAVYADDLHGVVVLHETASRPDGVVLDMNGVHVLAFDQNGLTTDVWNLPNDPDEHDRFYDGV